MSGIGLFQQLIKRQTTSIGSGVSNVHGKAAQRLVEAPTQATGAWAVAGFAQRQSVELREVLLAWGAGDRVVQTVPVIGGVAAVDAALLATASGVAQVEAVLVHGAFVMTSPLTMWM